MGGTTSLLGTLDVRVGEFFLDNSSCTNYVARMESGYSSRNIIDLIARIREAANLLIERELQTRKLAGIVPAHGLVFAFLFRQNGPVPMKALVQESGRVKSTVTGMVNTLEKHGYLYKQDCCDDARSTLIGLTEKGKAIRHDFEEISAALEKQVYGDMRQDDRSHVMALLAEIEGNLTG